MAAGEAVVRNIDIICTIEESDFDKLEDTITISDEIYNNIVRECSDGGA